jgi:hypothetical protein
VYRAGFSGKDAIRITATGELAKSAKRTSGVICAPARDEKTVNKAATVPRSVISKEAERCAGSKVTVLTGDSPAVKVTVPDRPRDKRAGRLLVTDYELHIALFRL